MKNRLFLIIIGLCFVSILSVALLRILGPQSEAPTKTESVQESAESTDIPDNSGANPVPETDASSEAFGSDVDIEKLMEILRSKDPDDIEKLEAELSETLGADVDIEKLMETLRSKDLGPEMAARVDAGMKFMKKKMEGLEVGEFPDLNVQEFMDALMGESGVKFDLAEISQQAFRRHFPEGEPADYEAEMAERIHKIVANTPGAFHKVRAAVTMGLVKEQDFQSWALANFKGEIGQQMKWMTDQILIAGEMENIQYTVPEDLSTFFPTVPGVETQISITPTPKPQTATSDTESTEPPPVRSGENGTAATETSETVSTPPMSAARINAIRDILSQNGTDAGLLKLLETDKDAANYLLERFSSATEIEAWLSKQATERAKPTSDPREAPPQPSPPEEQP